MESLHVLDVFSDLGKRPLDVCVDRGMSFFDVLILLSRRHSSRRPESVVRPGVSSVHPFERLSWTVDVGGSLSLSTAE